MSKLIVSATLGSILLLWLVGAALIFSASPLMTTSISHMQTSIDSGLNDTKTLFNTVVPTISATITSLGVYLQQDVALFQTVIDIPAINTTVKDQMLPLADSVDQTQSNVSTMLANANQISSDRSTLMTDLNTLSTGVFYMHLM